LVLKRLFTVSIVVILIAVTLIALIVYVTPPRTPPPDQLESITVGAEFSQVNTLLFVAQNMNYFSQNGLNVTIKPYISGAAALGAMVDGDVNIAASSEFTVVAKILADSNISIIGTIDRFLQINIVARTDRGIQNVTNLANKSIGLTPGTSAEYFFGRFLELNQMNHSQVKTVNIQPNHMVEALSNGTVDAVVTWQPYLYQIHKQMANDIVEWPAQSGQQVYSVLSATTSWITTHNKTVNQFLTALSQAENYLQSNPSDVKNLLMNQLNYTNDYIESVWPDHKFTVTLDQSLVLIMEDEARWLIANNLTNSTSIPNFQNYIYTDNTG
jgi:ABC-type nitrate/sulfonate/bicarbonate transport system substrate-binding protein